MAKTNHVFATETECATDEGLVYKVEAKSILYDLKALMRDYYAATFTQEENALKLQFSNGQAFILSAKEV